MRSSAAEQENLIHFCDGIFRGTSGTDYSYGNHESDSLSVWANAFPVTRLKVSKVWNDTSNVYGTRVLDKNGNWTVSFAVQRRAVKLEAGSTWKSPGRICLPRIKQETKQKSESL